MMSPSQPPILFPATNPFRQRSESENFPPFLEAIRETSYAESMTSFNLSIGAQAALNEHLRHLAKFGLDSKDSSHIDGEEKKECTSNDSETAETSSVTSPTRQLNEEWDRLLDASMSYVSMASSIFCGSTGLLMASMKDSLTRQSHRLAQSPSDIGRMETITLSPRSTCREIDCKGYDDEGEEENGSSYFDSSAVWALTTPERVRNRSANLEALPVTSRRGGNNSRSPSSDRGEECSRPNESFDETTMIPCNFQKAAFHAKALSPHHVASPVHSPGLLTPFTAMDISIISGVSGSSRAPSNFDDVISPIPSVELDNQKSSNGIEGADDGPSPFPSPKQSMSSLQQQQRRKGNLDELTRKSPFRKLDWFVMDPCQYNVEEEENSLEENDIKQVHEVPWPQAQEGRESCQLEALAETIRECAEKRSPPVETETGASVQVPTESNIVNEDEPDRNFGPVGHEFDNALVPCSEQCDGTPRNKENNRNSEALSNSTSVTHAFGPRQENGRKSSLADRSSSASLKETALYYPMTTRGVEMRYNNLIKQNNAMRNRLRNMKLLPTENTIAIRKFSRTTQKPEQKEEKSFEPAVISTSYEIATDESFGPSLIASPQSTDDANTTTTPYLLPGGNTVYGISRAAASGPSAGEDDSLVPSKSSSQWLSNPRYRIHGKRSTFPRVRTIRNPVDPRRYRTVVPVRVYLDSSLGSSNDSSEFYPGGDSFSNLMHNEKSSYARLFAKATESREMFLSN